MKKTKWSKKTKTQNILSSIDPLQMKVYVIKINAYLAGQS